MNARRFLPCVLLVLLLVESAAAQTGERGDSARSRERALEQAPPSLREWVESLPEGQRRPALRRLGNMPAHRRNTFFRRWEAMEEGERRKLQAFLEERAEARERGDSARSWAGGDSARSRAGGERPFRDRLEQLSPESREKLAPLVRRWRGMEPAERRRMRQRLERFRTLSPEDQQALIEKKFSEKSPEERAQILDSLREASMALPERPLLEAEPEQIAPAPEE